MPDRFEFATAGRILFGVGTLRQVGPLAAEMGKHALVVTSSDPTRAAPLLDVLRMAGLNASVLAIQTEPKIQTALAGVEMIQREGCDLVIGMGGGAALDAGKAIAALATNPGDPLNYLEVIGKAQPLRNPPLPYIAIPTTAGTGSEVTRNAVLTSDEHKLKVSLRSPLMLPRVAVIDPELAYSLPPELTASTGLDALTQVIEPFVCNRPNALTDGFCREGMRRAARSLRRACEEGSDPEAREDMALASLCGGLALANARLGAVHGFAAPIGGLFNAPHGAICACLLPHVMLVNVRALGERQESQSGALARYEEVAQILTGNPAATAEQGVIWVNDLVRALRVPALRAYGVKDNHFPMLIDKASAASSMQGNPIKLTASEMVEILTRAL